MTTWSPPHHPEYIYCGDPETCCGHWWPVAICCAVDHQSWPCDTKRGVDYHAKFALYCAEIVLDEFLGRRP